MYFKPHFILYCWFILILAVQFLIARQAQPASLTFAWDPADNQADGYALYYGIESGTYDVLVDVGPDTSYTVTGLDPFQVYFVAVTAYNALGESDFSDELVVNPPYYCEADFDTDGDVDGNDLTYSIENVTSVDLLTRRLNIKPLSSIGYFWVFEVFPDPARQFLKFS